MDDRVQDYLFDLQGYLVLKNAISAADLREMNQWIDRPRIVCTRAVVNRW